jgi:hypothetical protein
MFDKGGPEAFAAAVDGAVAGSRYPDGVAVGVISRFHPESRELVVHCELPRQDVIPKVVAYRYRPREKISGLNHIRTPRPSACTGSWLLG